MFNKNEFIFNNFSKDGFSKAIFFGDSGGIISPDIALMSMVEKSIYEFDTVSLTYNSMVARDSNNLVMFSTIQADAYLKTFLCNEDYSETTTTASLDINLVSSSYNVIAKIDDTHYIGAYTSSLKGYIITFEILTNGSLNVTHTLEHSVGESINGNELLLLDDTHIALAYNSNVSGGTIKIFEISTSFVLSEISYFVHDLSYGSNNKMIKMSEDVLMLTYGTTGEAGVVKTLKLNNDWTFTPLQQYNSVGQMYYSILTRIDNTHALLSYGSDYSSTVGHGWLSVVETNATYTTIQLINSVEHELSGFLKSSIIGASKSDYLLAYGTLSKGHIKKVNLLSDYSIAFNQDIYGDIGLAHPVFADMGDLVYALSYSGLNGDGYIKTIKIEEV